MSIASTPAATGLPPINEALEPAAVRNGTPATKQAYTTALQFEDVLVRQLSESLVQSSGLGGEGASEAGSEAGGSAGTPDAASGALASLLPQALADGVMSQGGLGLANQLMGALSPGVAGAVGAAGSASPMSQGGAATDSTNLTSEGGIASGAPAGGSRPPLERSGGVAA